MPAKDAELHRSKRNAENQLLHAMIKKVNKHNLGPAGAAASSMFNRGPERPAWPAWTPSLVKTFKVPGPQPFNLSSRATTSVLRAGNSFVASMARSNRVASLLRGLPDKPSGLHSGNLFYIFHVCSGCSGWTWPLTHLRESLKLPEWVEVHIFLLDKFQIKANLAKVRTKYKRNTFVHVVPCTQAANPAWALNALRKEMSEIKDGVVAAPQVMIFDTECYGRNRQPGTKTMMSKDFCVAKSFLLWLVLLKEHNWLPSLIMGELQHDDAPEWCMAAGLLLPQFSWGPRGVHEVRDVFVYTNLPLCFGDVQVLPAKQHLLNFSAKFSSFLAKMAIVRSAQERKETVKMCRAAHGCQRIFQSTELAYFGKFRSAYTSTGAMVNWQKYYRPKFWSAIGDSVHTAAIEPVAAAVFWLAITHQILHLHGPSQPVSVDEFLQVKWDSHIWSGVSEVCADCYGMCVLGLGVVVNDTKTAPLPTACVHLCLACSWCLRADMWPAAGAPHVPQQLRLNLERPNLES